MRFWVAPSGTQRHHLAPVQLLGRERVKAQIIAAVQDAKNGLFESPVLACRATQRQVQHARLPELNVNGDACDAYRYDWDEAFHGSILALHYLWLFDAARMPAIAMQRIWCACCAVFDTDSILRLRQKNTRQRAVRLGDDPDRRLVFQAVPRRTISILSLRAAWLSEETAFHNQLYAPTLDGPRKRSRTLKKHAAAGWVDISARSRTISSSFELNQQRTKPRGQERAD